MTNENELICSCGHAQRYHGVAATFLVLVCQLCLDGRGTPYLDPLYGLHSFKANNLKMIEIAYEKSKK